MPRLDDNSHTQWMQSLVDGIFDLGGQTFLHLKATRISLHHAGNLAQSCDIAIGNVAHMRLANERNQMMLTQGIHLYIFDNHHLAIILLEAGRKQNLHRVLFVAMSEKLHRLGYTQRCLKKALALRIFPQKFQNGGVVFLKLGQPFRIVLLNGFIAQTLPKLFIHHQPIFCLGIATVDC